MSEPTGQKLEAAEAEKPAAVVKNVKVRALRAFLDDDGMQVQPGAIVMVSAAKAKELLQPFEGYFKQQGEFTSHPDEKDQILRAEVVA